MEQLNATDAARKFSDVLDSVEAKGKSFIVVRRGRPVATISPTTAGTGLALKQALREHEPDSSWSEELRELRESVGPASNPWRD